MTPLAFAKLYAVTAPILFAIDLVWLGVVAKALARGFPTIVAVVDIAWGTILSAAVAVASYKLASWVL